MNVVVMVGTNPYMFDRMLKPVDDMAKERGWKVFMQTGNSNFKPENCVYKDFIERGSLIDYIKKADVVITHGGFGSIKDALSYNKPIIAVPRDPKYGESQDMQEEMVREMEECGYIIGLYDMSELSVAFDQALNFTPADRIVCRIPSIIENYLRDQRLLP